MLGHMAFGAIQVCQLEEPSKNQQGIWCQPSTLSNCGTSRKNTNTTALTQEIKGPSTFTYDVLGSKHAISRPHDLVCLDLEFHALDLYEGYIS